MDQKDHGGLAELSEAEQRRTEGGYTEGGCVSPKVAAIEALIRSTTTAP